MNTLFYNLLFPQNTLWTIYYIFLYMIFISFIIFLISVVIYVHCEILLTVYKQREKIKITHFHYPDIATSNILLLMFFFFFLSSFFSMHSQSSINGITLFILFWNLCYHVIRIVNTFPCHKMLFYNSIWVTLCDSASKTDDL